MPHKENRIPAGYVSSLHINGLNGRVLRIPNAKKKREIMLIYGHHSSLERMYGFAEDVSQYGTVTMPDLPGFGGMDSLYKIGEEASIDTLADYLAAVIKLTYKKRRFTLAGFSIGFCIVTRMLQKYPDIAKQVNLLVSVAGFTNNTDFKFSPTTKFIYRHSGHFFSGKWRARAFRYTALNTLILKSVYKYMPNAKYKFKSLSKDKYIEHINFEVELWHNNDVRTYMRTGESMMTVDLSSWKVDLPVRHISLAEADQYFDEKTVVAHLKDIYTKCVVDHAKMDNHMPSVVEGSGVAGGFIPKATRNLLAKNPK